MEYCYKCGVSDAKAFLFDVVLLEGINKICRKCSYEENLPVIKKFNSQEEVIENLTVHERLSKLSGFEAREKEKAEELKKEEVKLNEIVNRNFRRTVGTKNLGNELIDNFHWVVMRARRSRHLMQKEMADKIKESEVSIRMFEKGVVNDMNLVKKIENFLSIRLRKKIEEPVEEIELPKFETNEEIDNFDKDKFKGLTVEDLKQMKDEKEFEIFEESSDWAYASPKKGEEKDFAKPPRENERPDSEDFELLDDFENERPK